MDFYAEAKFLKIFSHIDLQKCQGLNFDSKTLIYINNGINTSKDLTKLVWPKVVVPAL